ncbi:MAG: alpha/beta fold hydrolase [Proteobacteria bacterium]|nr:alpha/beta fold hydrolase [Pseudomonadota bacterium]
MSARAFERPATISVPESDWALEGLWLPVDEPRGGAAVAAPHPLMGGSMESPVVGELAFACESQHYSSLRFNWRGVGASGGEATDALDAAAADVDAALDFVRDSVEGRVVACGYSFGAGVVSRRAVEAARVQRLVLVAPPVAMLDRSALASFRGRTFVAVGENDSLVPWRDLEAVCADLAEAEFCVIPEADHFFMAGLAELGRAVARWL